MIKIEDWLKWVIIAVIVIAVALTVRYVLLRSSFYAGGG